MEEKIERTAFSAKIKADLFRWMKDESARQFRSMTKYLERLIAADRERQESKK